jgi:hypothetical protein
MGKLGHEFTFRGNFEGNKCFTSLDKRIFLTKGEQTVDHDKGRNLDELAFVAILKATNVLLEELSS